MCSHCFTVSALTLGLSSPEAAPGKVQVVLDHPAKHMRVSRPQDPQATIHFEMLKLGDTVYRGFLWIYLIWLFETH